MAERRYVVTQRTSKGPEGFKQMMGLEAGAVYGGMKFHNVPESALPLLARFGFRPEGNASRPATKRSPSKPSPSMTAREALNAVRLARLKRGG